MLLFPKQHWRNQIVVYNSGYKRMAMAGELWYGCRNNTQQHGSSMALDGITISALACTATSLFSLWNCLWNALEVSAKQNKDAVQYIRFIRQSYLSFELPQNTTKAKDKQNIKMYYYLWKNWCCSLTSF